MPDKNDILVKTLQDALQQAQKYIIAGILSAALFILVDNKAPELLRSGDRVDIPQLGKVPSGVAAIVLFSGYFVFCFLAISVIRRIRKIASQIDNKEIRSAALTQFSIVTVESRLLRIITVLIAPALLSASIFIERSRGATPSLLAIIVAFPLLFLPYLFLLYQVLTPIKKEEV
jgi:uncharacterized membrane protein